MFTVADMNQMAASQCGGYKRPERAEERPMRNTLTELTDRIDDHNIAMAKAVTELNRLHTQREDIISDGARIGLKKMTMGKMLADVKVKYAGPGSGVETPLGDVLPSFEEPTELTVRLNRETQRDPTNPMTNGNPGGSNPSAPGTDWRDDTIPQAIRPAADDQETGPTPTPQRRQAI